MRRSTPDRNFEESLHPIRCIFSRLPEHSSAFWTIVDVKKRSVLKCDISSNLAFFLISARACALYWECASSLYGVQL